MLLGALDARIIQRGEVGAQSEGWGGFHRGFHLGASSGGFVSILPLASPLSVN